LETRGDRRLLALVPDREGCHERCQSGEECGARFGHGGMVRRRAVAGPYSRRHSAEVGFPDRVIPGVDFLVAVAVGREARPSLSQRFAPHDVIGRVDDADVFPMPVSLGGQRPAGHNGNVLSTLMKSRPSMVQFAEICQFSDSIAQEFHPEKIILFGSYAYGQPDEDSDVDLLVIMAYEGRSQDARRAIRRRATASFATDVLVRTPEDVERRYREWDPLVREALDKGVILYERDGSGVAQQGGDGLSRRRTRAGR
jgi:predicted nucleotidyltransferase